MPRGIPKNKLKSQFPPVMPPFVPDTMVIEDYLDPLRIAFTRLLSVMVNRGLIVESELVKITQPLKDGR